jgi:hypothetical protein
MKSTAAALAATHDESNFLRSSVVCLTSNLIAANLLPTLISVISPVSPHAPVAAVCTNLVEQLRNMSHNIIVASQTSKSDSFYRVILPALFAEFALLGSFESTHTHAPFRT